MKWLKLILVLFIFISPSYGQIMVNNAVSDTAMAQSLIGSGVTISNISHTCPPGAYGTFNSATTLGISSGIVLTSGSATGVVGPNTINTSMANAAPGDTDLDTILINNAGGGFVPTTNDACALEFDVLVQHDTLLFNYVFGSEEYEEFVGTFNDVFALIISGPGIVGKKNIALLPNSTTPISINNVNCTSNTTYYVCNDATNTACSANCPASNATTELEYDGYTTVLTAIQAVIPNNTYHLKLVVADAADQIFDSGVFIQGYSLKSISANQSNGTSLPTTKNSFIKHIANPILKETNIQLSNNEVYQVRVLNCQGLEIIKNNHVQYGFNLDLNNQSNGLYILELKNSNGTKQMVKLLKQ